MDVGHTATHAPAATPERPAVLPEWLLLVLLLAGSFAIHLWLVAHTHATARDSVAFARIAGRLDDPNRAAPPDAAPRTRRDVLREEYQPPGYPLLVWLASGPVRAATTAPLPDQLLLSTQVASLLVSPFLVLVHYRLGRELFGRGAGAVGAALFQTLPVAASVTSDGLSEGLFLTLLGGALLVGLRALRDGRAALYFWCGLLSAAAYLTRPEGLLAGAVVGAAAVGLGVARRVPRRAVAVRVGALVCGVVVLAGPYVATIGGVTNKPSGQKMLRWFGPPAGSAVAPEPRPQAPLFAEWAVSGAGGRAAVRGAGVLAREFAQSFHFASLCFVMFGLGAVGRALRRGEPGVVLLAVFAAANLALLVGLAATTGYVSERHTLPLVLLGCAVAGAGILPFGRWCSARLGWESGRHSQAIAVVFVVAVCGANLVAALRPLHASRAGHVHAGHWLAAHAGPDDVVVDPYEWAQFYAGRTLYRPVPQVPARPAAFYVVLEQNKRKSSSAPPPLHQSATEMAGRGQRVYHWPEHVPLEAARVAVYKVTLTQP